MQHKELLPRPRRCPGADPARGFVGFGRTPSETKKFFEAILVGRGLNLARRTVYGDMKKEVGVVETGLKKLSLKRICASRV